MACLFHQGNLLVRDGDQFIGSSIILLGQTMEENGTSVLRADELSSGWVSWTRGTTRDEAATRDVNKKTTTTDKIAMPVQMVEEEV